MFSTGHLIWIGISVALIIGGFIACRVLRPPLERVLRVCLWLGVVSEVVKVFSVSRMLPIVEPGIHAGKNGAEIVYNATGEYAPYLEMRHLPLELCSLMIVLIIIVLLVRDETWRKRLLTLMYITGTIGGTLGIFLAYVATEYATTAELFASPRVWQYFLYHAMVVTLGLYLGFREGSGVSIRSLGSTLTLLIGLDLPSFYLNSVFAQPVYVDRSPVGLVYPMNLFSSYLNPIGLVLKEKWQWIAYLGVRLVIAVTLISFLLCLPAAFRKTRPREENPT